MLKYSGIGSRETPAEILTLMEDFAYAVASFSIMRSGGADGADSAFEFGATLGGGIREIFLPWKGFNGCTDAILHEPTPEAYEVAAQFHPRWKYLRMPAQKLHARNSHQIMGASLHDPVNLVVCWTPGAKGGGGTGQALRIANHYEIEIWDLADPEMEQCAREIIGDDGIELR